MPDTQWHLDKRVPVALIFGLLMQFGGFVWFASEINSRLSVAERDGRTINTLG